ncbi:hypothetical protein BC332_13820 [Capsicum chinense]|nr:hypothetical protein BC332_13820 [Capsicum chinense]
MRIVLATNGPICEKCLMPGRPLPTALSMMHIVNKRPENAKEREREMKEKLDYLTGFVAAFKEQIHTDIHIKPGNNGPSIPTHRDLLAARSVIIKNMLDSDECKAPSDHTIVSLPELSYEELDSLLEFLYTGELPQEKLAKHVYALSLAADKYEIPFLLTYCECETLRSLNTVTALDNLEMPETHPNPHIKLKEIAMSFIIEHIKDIVNTPRFDALAAKYPHLVLQILKDTFAAPNKKRKLRIGVGQKRKLRFGVGPHV